MKMTASQWEKQELHQETSNEEQRSASKKLTPNHHDEQDHHHAKCIEQHVEDWPWDAKGAKIQ